jgi:hypothetical protein
MSGEVEKIGNMGLLSIAEMKVRYDYFLSFSKDILKKDLDYGIVPGTKKPSLLKPGAEKLRVAFGLSAEMNCIERTIQMDPQWCNVTYKCTVKDHSGRVMSECEGNCNSFEEKYRWIWKDAPAVSDEESAAGVYAGTHRWYNNRYFQEKRPNPEVVGKLNTYMKMAQKRAFVGAILMATGASEFYTQDLEDMETFDAEVVDIQTEPVKEYTEEEKEEIAVWQPEIDKCKTPEELKKLSEDNVDVLNDMPHVQGIIKEAYFRLQRAKPATNADKAKKAAASINSKLNNR